MPCQYLVSFVPVDLCASIKKLLNTRMIVWRENCDKIANFIECFDGV